jgi:hypothetical protein
MKCRMRPLHMVETYLLISIHAPCQALLITAGQGVTWAREAHLKAFVTNRLPNEQLQ